MEGNESGLNSYYQSAPSVNNGMFSSPNPSITACSSVPPYPSSSDGFQQHLAPSGSRGASSSGPTEVVRRKRGRPRKYSPGTDSLPKPSNVPLSPRKKEPASAKKAQMVALGNAGQGFTPHVITVAAGEDVSQKIMSFMQQRKRAVCILSANGSISNATLRQPAMLGGDVTYEGRFEILSLSGSFLFSETGGTFSRTGGVSVCLSGSDGRIVGGGVGGPLVAACPVQVIVGSFVVDGKKDPNQDGKSEASGSKLSTSMVGAMPMNFRSLPESSSPRISGRGNEDQSMGSGNYIMQHRSMHMMASRSTDWRGGHIDSDPRSDVDIDLTGRGGHGLAGACHSPEDGDDDHIGHGRNH
ncbi:hypothetical protein AMTRI_Chr06g174480 [Amborella trichopoda]|uniref:AT-hook motif nuclear-localized protein n=1 Tax=Amborella trichopoda TaxID=13333 RepID=W1PGM4_AMBTC|nr:AT-hook motif nuclear-localized protein 14 [Amborella trichopoda]ERN06854.1 hypothetical protein AMTR_s00005p00240090 [Amborella trichopoda]|eukprot:XP_006845179.1 AT-hook motif nuclear-localized protein 14 [Amborella trichopoda]